MNFRSSGNPRTRKNKELNTKARKLAAEYCMEVLFLQYNTLLFNCDKSFNEIINFRLFNGPIPSQCHTEKSIGELLLLRQRSIQDQENSKKQKESHQENLLANLALSAREQIQNQAEKDLEPKLDMFLAHKVKSAHNVPVARQQFMRADPQFEDYPIESESTLSKFARQNFGVELGIDSDDTKPSAPKPSGRGSSFSRGGNTKFLDCYSMDIAPMNIFENQVHPVGIHNLSKSFRPNLATVRDLSLGTKFIPEWDTNKTGNTFKMDNEFRNQMNAKVFFSESE